MVHLRCKAEIQILCGSDPGDTATTLSQALEGRHTQTQPAESSSTVSSSRLVEYVVARLLGGRER